MHQNTQIATFNICVGYDCFNLYELEKIKSRKALKLFLYNSFCSKGEIKGKVGVWFRSRFFDLDRHNFYDISNQLSMNYNNRATEIMHAASFFTYGASLLDDYWFNPVDVMEIDFGEYMPTLSLTPTTWENVDFRKKEWSSDIAQLVEDSIFLPRRALREIRRVDLKSPDIALPGRFAKYWVKKDGKLYIKKLFPDTDEGKRLCEQHLKISEFLNETAKGHGVLYIPDEKHDNVCYCERFLRENEDFLSPLTVILSNKSALKKLKENAIGYNAMKLGCKKELLDEREEILKSVESKFNVYRNYDNFGFIVNGKEGKISKLAPIYGTFLLKHCI